MRDDSQKVVLVTGASQGLGAGIAREYARLGYRVMLCSRTEEKLRAVAASIIADGGTASFCVCDIADERSVASMIDQTEAEFGPVDILINNAAYHRSVAVVDTSKELWDAQIATNLTGTFLCTRAVLPSMIERRYGKILNISSSAAKHFFPGFGAYAASKGGIVSFTHTLSEEVKDRNINVNAIYLGMTNTDHTQQRMNDDAAVSIPLEQMMQIEEVLPVVTFLTSDAAHVIMGAAIDVFGKKS
jgi:NAD(P)-dependent dehydrogenase (short-subunit alcohol dehydrogenase family)